MQEKKVQFFYHSSDYMESVLGKEEENILHEQSYGKTAPVYEC